MTICYISIGSNKGDRSKFMARALDYARKHFTIIDISSFYFSQPVYTNQDRDFINCIIKIETDQKPLEIYEKIGLIERQLGKINVVRDDNKTIDIDLLYFGDKIIENKDMMVPHHKAHQRKYVLVAMNELDPEFINPVLGKSQKQMLDENEDDREVKKIPDLS